MSASLGHALAALGYTRTLMVMHPDEQHPTGRWKKTFPFNADAHAGQHPLAFGAAEILARWGYDARLTAGSGGEGTQIKDETPEVLAALGLPPGYRWTSLDFADAGRLTRDGVTWACDDPRCPIGIPYVVVPPPPPPPPPPPVDPPPPPPPPATMSDPAVRAEELASLLAPVYDAVRNRSFWTRRLPTWAELWPVAKPLAVELVKSVRRTAGRVR